MKENESFLESPPVVMEYFTGKLDRNISELILVSKNYLSFDEADRQTLKHHLEDLDTAVKTVRNAISNAIIYMPERPTKKPSTRPKHYKKRSKFSIMMEKRWANPEFRAKTIAGIKRSKQPIAILPAVETPSESINVSQPII